MHRRLRRLLLLVPLVAAATVAGCVGKYKSDFQVIIQNRAVNAILVSANGQELGQIAAGQQGQYTLNLTESNTNTFTNGVAPTPQGQVTFTAKDVRTNATSTPKSLTLSGSSPTYLTFASADFPVTVQTIARFSVSPTNPGPNQDITFNASASTPNTGTFSWNFGDGSTGAGVSVTKRYAQPGTYAVTLTVTSDTGQSATATSNVNVSTQLPGQSVNFTFSPANPGINQEIFFNASTSNVNGGTFAWDFGDGSTATGITTSHRYTRAGTYTVTLRATNNVGQAAGVSRNVTVSANSPTVTASFTFSPTNPGINQEIFFNAAASTPANGTYTWNFGDGTSGTGITPTHRYDAAGTYAVTLTVTNDIGQSATTSRNVNVSATSAQVTASFVFSPTVPGIGQDVFFDASASRPVGATFTWNFGDGTTGTGVSPTHQYNAAATYTVVLVVTNEFGQTATTSRTITVTSQSPQVVASFTFSPTNPGLDQDVFFNASASRPSDGTFTWNFGDGSSGTGIAPTHRYTLAATYTVTLTVSNANGQFASTTRTVTVSTTSAVIVADFTFSPTDPTISLSTNNVIFDATPSTQGVTSWTWDFGDGTANATGQRVTHTFTRPGTWVVRLTVADGGGRTATVTKNVTVAP